MDSMGVEREIKSLIKVWITVFASLTYCYFISQKIPKGKIRLLFFLPIITIFTLLPLNLHSIHLTGTTGFFISWLCNFKLLLLAFDQGPLYSSNPSLSLPYFISIACLPIKIKQSPDPQSQNPLSKSKIKQNPSLKIKNPHSESKIKQNPSLQIINPSEKQPKSPFNYAVKIILLAMVVSVYEYKQHLHPTLILFLYCFHIYFLLELILVVVAAMVRSLLGLELEPQFEDPYRSTSLQDFWGRKWNLMVTSILRPTVYLPVRSICTRMFGKKWAVFLSVQATFAVSGLMHELIFFYFGRVWPTWEVMWFFAFHGICMAVEVEVKERLTGRCRLPWWISGPLTVGFVAVTGFWLFFPQILRCGADVRAIREYTIIGEYFKGLITYYRHNNPPR